MTSDSRIWLERFFSKGNDWSVDKIRRNEYPGKLQLLLEEMLHRPLQDSPPFILPRLSSKSQLSIYIVGEGLQQLGELRRVFAAYLGEVRTKLDPTVFSNSDDPIEQALLERFPHGFSKIIFPMELNEHKQEVFAVFEAINSALERYLQRPAIVSITQRPIGRVLSDFYVARSSGNGDAALELFEELKAAGSLSTRNLLSIELQALATGSQWQRLFNHPSLPDILNGRIPGVITDVLLDAVMHVAVPTGGPEDYDIEVLRSDLGSLRDFFYRQPDLGVESRLEHWKVWGIAASAFGYPRVLESIPAKIVGQEWIDSLVHWAGITRRVDVPTSPVESVISAEPSLSAAIALLQQSLALNQREGLAIYQRLSTYPTAILAEIESHSSLRGVWESLESEFATPVGIHSWSKWLESLVDSAEATLSIQSITEKCRYWEPGEWDEKLVIEQLYDLADSPNFSVVRDIVPVLRNWLHECQISPSAEFIEQLAVILTVDDIYSAQDLVLFSELIDDLARIPHTQQQYGDVLNAAEGCWSRVKSINSLTQGLEIMDILLDSSCADTQARLHFWNALQEFCISNWGRLSDDQQLVVLQTSVDTIGSSSQFPPMTEPTDKSPSKLINLTNKKVAIYTLTRGAALRARKVLGELFPNIDVQLNHDMTATPSLINLAETADYFIFASRSAAHQAFYPVTKRRDDILYPSGKGSSSIVRCFLDSVLS